jgi:trehalose 6-phosphate phosphatase
MAALPKSADGHAFFLDFDGTLVDIAPTPDAVIVPPSLPALLTRLEARAGGALAVVSGRTVAAIDHLLDPLRLTVAGVHGAEVRLAGGERLPMAVPASIAAAREIFRGCMARFPALLLEDKGAALSLHYRAAPELEHEALACAQQALAAAPGLALQRGKMVVEVRPAGVDKGRALAALMERAPFRGRVPVAVGDDLTDEHMFAVAARLGGAAIRVGAGADLPDPGAVRAWLATLV